MINGHTTPIIVENSHERPFPIIPKANTNRFVGSMLRRRRSPRKKRFSAEAVCMGWPKVPNHEASVLQTDLKIE
jgi:hypothetical protein